MGDYAKDTANLTLVQHGAYRVLIDHYYAIEEPLPSEPDDLYRIARAFTKSERDAVDFVVKKFFTLKAGFYHKSRINKEIEKYAVRAAINKQNAQRNKSDSDSDSLDDSGSNTRYQIPDTRIPDNQKPEREAGKPPPRPKFVKPTIREIRAYCDEIGATINPATFFNHYETVGWKVGKNPMKDWKAAVRGWNSREQK